jgi:hypothetical protein
VRVCETVTLATARNGLDSVEPHVEKIRPNIRSWPVVISWRPQAECRERRTFLAVEPRRNVVEISYEERRKQKAEQRLPYSTPMKDVA